MTTLTPTLSSSYSSLHENSETKHVMDDEKSVTVHNSLYHQPLSGLAKPAAPINNSTLSLTVKPCLYTTKIVRGYVRQTQFVVEVHKTDS